jgi:hypothetical protein
LKACLVRKDHSYWVVIRLLQIRNGRNKKTNSICFNCGIKGKKIADWAWLMIV